MIDLHNGDCLQVMDDLIAKGIKVDCIITDPPYNIKKADWDKWKCQKEYAKWLVDVFIKARLLLKDNGSFYFFHNDFLQIVNIQNEINDRTDYIFKQFIVWNKRFSGCKLEHYLQGHIEVNQLRNYKQMAEYLLFYTLQDETGLSKINNDINHYKTLREYFKNLQNFIGLNKKEILNKMGQSADHCFRHSSSQWSLPTKETYQKLIDIFNIKQFNEYKEYEELKKEYDNFRKQYEGLIEGYESLRYTYNNQKTHHSIWNYEVAEKQGHITPKPVDLMENIIKHSTNENDLVLDMFMGSGTTGVACKNLNRSFIGIELDKTYFELAKERIEK